MTKKEKNKIIDAWAKSNVLCGILDLPESDLKDKLGVQKRLSFEIHQILSTLIGHG